MRFGLGFGIDVKRGPLGGNTPVYPDCFYAFNSTDEQVQPFGYAGAVAISEQTGAIAIQGGLVSNEQRLSTNGAFQAVDISAGKKVIEVQFQASAPNTVGTFAAIGVKLLNASTFETVAGLSMQISDLGVEFFVVGAGNFVRYGDSDAPQTVTAGLEFDAETGTFRAIIGNTSVALTDDAYAGVPCLLTIETSEVAGGDADDAGITLSATVRTGGADITQAYGASATEICGNLL